MKKLTLIYIIILIVVFVVLSFFGRGDNFAIEQKLWSVHKKYAEIARDPKVVPDQTFDDVINKYQSVIDQHPDSKIVRGLHLIIGEIYALRKDYQSSRNKFYEVTKLYPDDDNLAAEALVRVGRTYEIEENWSSAHGVYQQIISDYPRSNVALTLPIYIASYHKKKKDLLNMVKAYESAINYYRKIADENTDTYFGFNALRFLSNAYIEQGEWENAINAMAEILYKYNSPRFLNPQRADTMLKTINIIAAFHLDDYDLPIKVYQKFIDDNPEHPLSSYLQRMIDAFNELKKKGVKISSDKFTE